MGKMNVVWLLSIVLGGLVACDCSDECMKRCPRSRVEYTNTEKLVCKGKMNGELCECRGACEVKSCKGAADCPAGMVCNSGGLCEAYECIRSSDCQDVSRLSDRPESERKAYVCLEHKCQLKSCLSSSDCVEEGLVCGRKIEKGSERRVCLPRECETSEECKTKKGLLGNAQFNPDRAYCRDGACVADECSGDVECPEDRAFCLAVVDSPGHLPARICSCRADGSCHKNQDRDRDGASSGVGVNGGDCDDSDATVHPRAPEICDGKDNNCNGQIDEGFDVGGHCTVGKGVCLSNGQLVCKGGKAVCDAIARDQKTDEECNGKDDDCNGQIDDLRGPKSECTAICTAGAQTGSQKGRIVCIKATNEERYSRACIVDMVETCNNKDDDCDGIIDNAQPGKTDELWKECYSGSPETKGVADCRGGRQLCRAGEWSSCQGEALPTEEICDGKDNDCDGKTDNTAGKRKSCVSPNSNGRCSEGVEVCRQARIECVALHKATAELCNGKDDDCNGLVDDSIRSQPCEVPDPTLKGECLKSTATCENGKLVCRQTYFGGKTDVCDRKDNDCDGKIDNIKVSGQDRCVVEMFSRGSAPKSALEKICHVPVVLSVGRSKLYVACSEASSALSSNKIHGLALDSLRSTGEAMPHFRCGDGTLGHLEGDCWQARFRGIHGLLRVNRGGADTLIASSRGNSLLYRIILGGKSPSTAWASLLSYQVLNVAGCQIAPGVPIPSSPFVENSAIAVAPMGGLIYVANGKCAPNSARIVSIDQGGKIQDFFTAPNTPSMKSLEILSIAVDGTYLWMTTDSGNLYRVSLKSRVLELVKAGRFSEPRALLYYPLLPGGVLVGSSGRIDFVKADGSGRQLVAGNGIVGLPQAGSQEISKSKMCKVSSLAFKDNSLWVGCDSGSLLHIPNFHF